MTHAHPHGFLRGVPRSVRYLLTLATLAGHLACAQGACGTAYVYPSSGLDEGVEPLTGGARLRLTQAGLDFLQDRLPALLATVSDQLTVDPNQPDFFRIELTDALELSASPRVAFATDSDGNFERATTFWVGRDALTAGLRFALVEGNPEGIAARVENLPVGLEGRLFTGNATTEAACEVRGNNRAVCPGGAGNCAGVPLLTTVSFSLVLVPELVSASACANPQLGPCIDFRVEVAEVDLGPLDGNDLDLDPAPPCQNGDTPPRCSPECSDTTLLDSSGDAECRLLCGAQDAVAGVVTGIAGALERALGDFLQGWVSDALGEALVGVAGAPAQATGRVSLVETLPMLPATAPLDLGYLVGVAAPGFDVNCAPGTDCATARGLDILLATGFEPAPAPDVAPPHPCVVPVVGERYAALYGAAGLAVPPGAPLAGLAGAEPSHVGLSFSRAALNQALLALYHSGALCLELDSDAIDALTAGGFSFRAGTLNTLTGGRLGDVVRPEAPALLTLMPREPPIARLGAEARGGTVQDATIALDWRDIEVSAYVYAYERFTRLFAVDVDLDLTLRVGAPPGSETLELVVVEGPNLGGFRPSYGEWVTDVAFGDVLEGILGVALEPVLGQALAFSFDLGLGASLSQSTGVPLALSVDALVTVPAPGASPSSVHEFLNLYLSLRDAPASDAGP